MDEAKIETQLLEACEAALALAPRCDHKHCFHFAIWSCFDIHHQNRIRCTEHVLSEFGATRLQWADVTDLLLAAIEAARARGIT